jgi:hypothetical protein
MPGATIWDLGRAKSPDGQLPAARAASLTPEQRAEIAKKASAGSLEGIVNTPLALILHHGYSSSVYDESRGRDEG